MVNGHVSQQQGETPERESGPIVGPGIHNPGEAHAEVKKLETSSGEQPFADTRATDKAAAVNTDADPSTGQEGSGGYLSSAAAAATAAASAVGAGAAAAKDRVMGTGGPTPGDGAVATEPAPDVQPSATAPSAENGSEGSHKGAAHGIKTKSASGEPPSSSGRATISPADAERVSLLSSAL